MSQLDELAARIRALIAADPRVTEKRMFGGITFLLNGHILVAAKKDGRILAQVGKDAHLGALERNGAVQMVHGDKIMTGFIWVDPEAIADDEALRDWVELCERGVAPLPPK